MESLKPLQTLADFRDALSAARMDYNHSSANVVTNKTHIRNSRKMAFRSSFVTKSNNTGRSEPADTKKQFEVGQDVAASNGRESEERHIQIFVSNPVREILCLQLHPSTTISALKELLQEKLNIQAKTQHLVTKKGIELCDTQSLKVLGIQQDTNLELRLVAGLMGGTRKRKSGKERKCKKAKVQDENETENSSESTPEDLNASTEPSSTFPSIYESTSTGAGVISKNPTGMKEQVELQTQEPATHQSASTEKQDDLLVQSQRTSSTNTGAIPKNPRERKEQTRLQSQEEPETYQSASTEKQEHLVQFQRTSTGTGAIPKNPRRTKEQMKIHSQEELATSQRASPEEQDHLVHLAEEPKAHQSVSSAAGTINEIASNCGGKDIVPALHQDLAMRSQSSDVHTLCHHQSQAIVKDMSIGERSTVFMGTASGITMNQTFVQNVHVSATGMTELNHQAQTIADEAKEPLKKTHTTTGAPDPNHQAQAVGDEAKEALKQVYMTMTTGTPDPNHQTQAVAHEAEEALKQVYKNTGSFVQMLPWVDDDKIHIMDIYTKLVLVELVDKVGKIDKEKNQMESYKDIFHLKTREGNPIKRIVISGSAGLGKTTLIDKIAYDWAMGKSEILKMFELVFVLKMRALNQTSDLIDAIFDQLLDQDSVNKDVLKEFIDKNQDRVLILLDGFDEFQTTTLNESSFGSILNVLKRKQGNECWVVITSRPPLDKLVSSSLVEKPFTRVRIEGFSDRDIKEYVNKFFPEDHDKVGQLLEKIQSSEVLSDLAKSPMLLLLMCLLWRVSGKIPDTMTQLYTEALKYIFKRKAKDLSQDAISKILISIGKVALCGLISTNQSLSFKEEDFDKEAFNAALSAGVLTSERVFKGLDTHTNVYFIHKTFLEFCAAKYWQSLTNTEEFERILVQVCSTTNDYPSPYEYLLRFCCGDNGGCTDQVLQKLQRNEDPRLGLICYYESQSESLPSEDFIHAVVRTKIEIDGWNSDCLNSFFYFLKHVADQTKIQGSAYLSRVKHLSIMNCDLCRCGCDLAHCLTELTNMSVLSMDHCVSHYLNCRDILWLLANSRHLTELKILNLLNNRGKHPAGLAKDLTPNPLSGLNTMFNERRMKYLGEVHVNFSSCKLTGEDVGPIVELLGDMPTLVDLDLLGNGTLGGCASLWAPYLKRMKHLKNLKLTNCNLTGKDISPISESLSDMPTLVDLDLSCNYILGGCALVVRMKRLKEMKRGADKDPFAESLSDMHLDLCCNNTLYGCPSLWAPCLKTITHLKKINFSSCGLIGEDISPIALSLSDMPTLDDLDLSWNGALGGNASLWAPFLKRMKHLKKLVLRICQLSREDLGPISESLSDMLNLVVLDLSGNTALGSCASLWAPCLKKVKHLKELRLKDCSLGMIDLDPITESLSDSASCMLTLSDLCLTCYVLVGFVVVIDKDNGLPRFRETEKTEKCNCRLPGESPSDHGMRVRRALRT